MVGFSYRLNSRRVGRRRVMAQLIIGRERTPAQCKIRCGENITARFLSFFPDGFRVGVVMRVTETKYVFQRCPFHISLRSLFGSSILPFFP
jgi:hypothetical protein